MVFHMNALRATLFSIKDLPQEKLACSSHYVKMIETTI